MLRATVLAWLCLAGPVPALAQQGQAPSTDPNQVLPGRYVLDPAHGKVTWSVSHFGFSTFWGQAGGLNAELSLDPRAPARSRVSARLDAESVDGRDEALNRILRGPDFLDVARYPTITFSTSAVEPTGPTTARLLGTLSLHGATRPMVIDATFNRAGLHPLDGRYTVGFDGRAVIRRSEFGLTAFLPALGDEVTLRIEGEFKAAP